jgi:hypothetical protein
MNRHSSHVLLHVLLWLVLLTPVAYGGTILTGAELDTFGA